MAQFKYLVEYNIIYFELNNNLIAANTYFNDSLICISKTRGILKNYVNYLILNTVIEILTKLKCLILIN